MAKLVFVFGSNELGVHGAGAAKFAYEKMGARWGKSYGHYGDSFAIPTKDEYIQTIQDEERICNYIKGFLAYATGHRKLKFKVTQLGCGLAGLTGEYMSQFFMSDTIPSNVLFDEAWRPYLGDNHNYWGTYP